MRSGQSGFTFKCRLAAALLCAALAAILLLPLAAGAEAGDTVVRVGWYESPFNMMDENGRRSGYAYEYQQKIAAYTGWTYEYVEGSWPELMERFVNGELDILSDVSYTEERAERMLFSATAMGSEEYYIFKDPDNADIRQGDPLSLNGKRIGVDKGSVQIGLYREWAQRNGVEAELVEQTHSEEESLEMLHTGELDAYLTLDVYSNDSSVIPMFRIGASNFYFAVNKDRPDLLKSLDDALRRIQDENKFFGQQLYDKYLISAETKRYLDEDELAWLADHGAIRVGYQDNYLAFCAKDEATGALTGTLKDYLDHAATALKNARLDFEPIAFPTAADAIAALKSGEVDCVFPANLTAYDSETLDVVMSPALMQTEMDAVVRATDQKEFIRKPDVVVAVNEGNTNYERFLQDHFPGWSVKYFPDTPAGLDGVAAGEADCVVISNYRYSNIAKQCEKLHLATVYTGVDMDYYLALRRGDTELYSILAKTTAVVPDSVVHAALTYYSTEDAKISFGDLIKDNLAIVMTVIATILLVILILLLFSIRAQRKAIQEQHMVENLNKQVFVDALTHVRNKGGFDNYVQSLQDKLDQETAPEVAVCVFDCNDLKLINDQYGHDKGNIYLRAACSLICHVFQHSPVFRIGGDEFTAVLMNEDFRNREQLVAEFEQTQKNLTALAKNRWEYVSVALGIAVYDPKTDSTLSDTFRRADQQMYDYKNQQKAKR